MANTAAPYGLRPVRHLFGGLVRANEYAIASGYNTNIFRGSVVSTAPGTSRNLALGAAASAPFVGVFDGCQYVDTQGNVIYSHYWPANTTVKTGTTVKAWVFDDPMILFQVQNDGTFDADDIGKDGDLTAETGNTATGNSTMALDTSNLNTGDNVHVYGLAGDEAEGDYANVLVLINEHELDNAGAARFKEI